MGVQLVSLQPYNTFSLGHYCKELVTIHSEKALIDLIPFDSTPFVIGGGSNVLFTRDLDTTVLVNEIRGKEIVSVADDHVLVKIGSGEKWHEVVLWAIENDLGGIENLSLIPGKMGAAPIQNIGAYGVELESVFNRLDAIQLLTGRKQIFEKEDCEFDYRGSAFKGKYRDQYFITQVYLNLTIQGHHSIVDTYGQIKTELQNRDIVDPTIKDISDVVIDIRNSKLPDPEEIPNCGSFFKNPIISIESYAELEDLWPEIPKYPYDDYRVKVPAGWLIEKCGWKGRKVGRVGCHADHALVICNYGEKYGKEVRKFYEMIIESVKEKFGVILVPEVNIV